jgi:hypothetical protein
MPVAAPCQNAIGESPRRQSAVKLKKKDFLHVLRRAHIPEETIKLANEQLHDPVDEERDGTFLVRHGLDRDELISRMGGSP